MIGEYFYCVYVRSICFIASKSARICWRCEKRLLELDPDANIRIDEPPNVRFVEIFARID
jgi:hypothetical protein